MSSAGYEETQNKRLRDDIGSAIELRQQKECIIVMEALWLRWSIIVHMCIYIHMSIQIHSSFAQNEKITRTLTKEVCECNEKEIKISEETSMIRQLMQPWKYKLTCKQK